LHPDDRRYEALEPARVRPDAINIAAYPELISALRHDLAVSQDQPVPVYPFGYNWRQPAAVAAEQLHDFIAEVIDRTKLLRHYAQAGYAADPKVNLIGHSMGGLVTAFYLDRYGDDNLVKKVVTLGTPWHGSFEAVLKVVTGTSAFDQDSASPE